jgi:hypothetical protein
VFQLVAPKIFPLTHVTETDLVWISSFPKEKTKSLPCGTDCWRRPGERLYNLFSATTSPRLCPSSSRARTPLRTRNKPSTSDSRSQIPQQAGIPNSPSPPPRTSWCSPNGRTLQYQHTRRPRASWRASRPRVSRTWWTSQWPCADATLQLLTVVPKLSCPFFFF